MRHIPRKAFIATVLTLAIAAAAWGSWLMTWKTGLASLQRRGAEQLALHRDALDSAVERCRYLPYVLAQDAAVRRLLGDPHNARLAAETNAYLARVNTAAGAAASYIIAASGTTLASSNHNEPGSFVGQNYALRPYFQGALAHDRGSYYGIGLTTGQPGYFFAQRVAGENGEAGVAAVKISLGTLEDSWRGAGISAAITDAAGIAFLSSVEEWKYRPLMPLTETAKGALDASSQYKGVDLSSRSLLPAGGDARDGAIVSFRGRSRDAAGPPALLHRLDLPRYGWTLIALSDIRPLEVDASLAAWATALTLALAALLALFFRQRRQLVLAKLNAHAELEKRVEERTRELTREIAERARAEEELRQAQDGLVQAVKLAALGQMSAAIVHEVSQPLTAIETYLASSRILLERGDSGAAAENFRLVGGLIDRMRRMTRTLKAFARREQGAPEDADPGTVLQNAVELIRPRLDAAGVRFTAVNAAGPVTVRVSNVRLQQVFVNLLTNAADAVRGAARQLITVRIETGGGFARISVADSGPGVPAHLKSRIGEPFFTTKVQDEGLGLGLSISQAITGAAGGRITCEDGPEGGAVFTVHLPLAAPGAEEMAIMQETTR